MKLMLTLFILLVSTFNIYPQGIQFEFKAEDGLVSNQLFIDGDDVYFSFTSDSSYLYSTYLAKLNTKTEKVLWCKKISVENSVSIHPTKILKRKDGTLVLAAYDYSPKNGFSNGNYTFLQLDANGQILQSKRLGSPTGGILRDAIIDEDDSIIFLGERINAQSEYRTVIGRLDKNFDVVNIRSVFKQFYTYGFALQKDHDGNIYTVGHTQLLNSGISRSIATKWSKNLDHIATLMNLDEDPKTTFNYIFIDDDNQIHLGGNLDNLATYVRINKDFQFDYGHEFSYGYVRNIWKDESGQVNIYIDGSYYFVRLDENNSAQQFMKYGIIGNSSNQIFNSNDKSIYNFSFKGSEGGTKIASHLTSHKYSVDNECILFDLSGDINGTIRYNSFGYTDVIIKDEITSAIVPDDIRVSDYSLSVEQTCKVEDVSSAKEVDSDMIKIYPNPAQDFLYLDFDQTLDVSDIEVFNLQGQLQKVDQQGSGVLNLTNLASGIYIIKIINAVSNEVYVSKFQVIR